MKNKKMFSIAVASLLTFGASLSFAEELSRDTCNETVIKIESQPHISCTDWNQTTEPKAKVVMEELTSTSLYLIDPNPARDSYKKCRVLNSTKKTIEKDGKNAQEFEEESQASSEYIVLLGTLNGVSNVSYAWVYIGGIAPINYSNHLHELNCTKIDPKSQN